MSEIKGKKVKETVGEVNFVHTFSSEDLSMSMEVIGPLRVLIPLFMDIFKSEHSGTFGISISCIRKLKEDGMFFQAIEDSTEMIMKALEQRDRDENKNVSIKYEFYEDGTKKTYLDGKLLASTKRDKKRMRLLLQSNRDRFLDPWGPQLKFYPH